MGENDSLANIGVTGEWIWGDDAETTVYAQAYGDNRTLIFRFKANGEEPLSLPTRVANWYNDIDVPSEKATFPGRPSNGAAVLCGALEPFVPCGSLANVINEANMNNTRLEMAQKLDWCLQMATAIAQTHLVARNFHMDIKPGNFLVKDGTLVLIDWEQNSVPDTTAAPEVDGTCDVTTLVDGSLSYTKYTGPPRSNMPEEAWGNRGWSKWNVFILWREQCPKALELPEVFSVGRSMWMLLRQPDMDVDEIEDTLDLVEGWDECEDVPEFLKQVVMRCVNPDPLKRIGLEELVDELKAITLNE